MQANIICISYNKISCQNTIDSTLVFYNSIVNIKDRQITNEALNFFEKKAAEAISKRDTINAAYSIELIALGQFKLGYLPESESTTIRALELLDNMEHKDSINEPIERLSNQLGMIYRKMEDFENSLRYLNIALNLSTKTPNKMAIISNIANNHADLGLFNKAVEVQEAYSDEILALRKSSIKATYIDNLGYYKSFIGDLTALEDMKAALKMRLDLKDLTGLFSSYRHLALFHYNKGNTKEALNYSKMTRRISDSLGSPTYQKEAMKLALKFENNPIFKEYVELSDSLDKADLRQNNKYTAIKYDINKKDKLIKERELMLKSSELEKEKQRKGKMLSIFSGLLILSFSIFLYLFLRSRHKKEKIYQVYLTETRISKKVHDEVANDLYHVMTKIQSGNDKNEEVLDDLEGIYNKTRDISRANSEIDVINNYKVLVNDLLLSYKDHEINVITRNVSKIDWNLVSDLKKTTLYRVLQELMTNMRKHSKASLVVLAFNQVKGKIEIDYKDNGVGCKLVKQNGLLNMENRIESINGKITFESRVDDGFKVKIIV